MTTTYGRRADHISAYTFQARTYCPDCVIAQLPTGPEQPFDGWALAPGVRMTPEANLDEIAYAFGIDRSDESSFDSDDFPKVVFSCQIDRPTVCDRCGVDLH